MKIKLLSAFLAATAMLSSCSEDDTAPVIVDTAQELHKTVTFIPSKAAYDSNQPDSYKNVQYFENNKIVADSTFNSSGALEGKVVHSYTGNTHQFSVYGSTATYGNTPYQELTHTFDIEGRLIEEKITTPFSPSSSLTKFVYGSGIVSIEHYDTGTGLLMPQYTSTAILNSAGLIENGVVYTGDKIIKNNLSDFEVTLHYYDIPMPANMQKTVNQRNNLFLEHGESRVTTVENGNYYLKNYTYNNFYGVQETVNFDSQFDASGYITYTKGTGYVGAYQADRNLERFYYYE